ncbi:MAG: DHHA2 domain-containing protein, partial [Candidatus Altarchaeaceae archaeon]
ENEIFEFLKNLKDKENYAMVVFIATDIIKEGSEVYVVDKEKIEKIEKEFNVKFENNHAYIKGLMSRKKQVVPVIEKIFK